MRMVNLSLTRKQARKVKDALNGPSVGDKDLSDVYYMIDDALKPAPKPRAKTFSELMWPNKETSGGP